MSKVWMTFASTTTATAHVLINQLRLGTAKSVLEVGCGLGDGSNLAAQYLSADGQLISTDLSPEMIELAKRRFPKQNFQIANAEALPFSDGKFDRYLANFVLHLTPDPQKMAKEASRVLKKDGIAAFSVWGRPSQSAQIQIIPAAAKQVGITIPPPSWRSPGHLGIDSEETRKMLLAAGFSRVIAWYINQPMPCTTGECVVDHLMHSTQSDLVNKLPKSQREEWRKKAIELSESFFLAGKPMPFEVLVLVAVK